VTLQREAMALDDDSRASTFGLSSVIENDDSQVEADKIFFKGDRMYRHHLARFNYTTYDVRRSQDVVNPHTSHCNVMLLAKREGTEATSAHQFLYARVLGLYHVNVVYTGPGMLDYTPRKFYFLWVRWFDYVGRTVRWRDQRLDSLGFPPISSHHAFDFVDPRDVLRGCHIVPAFQDGRVHSDGIGLSRCAADSQDWRHYYVMRYFQFHFYCLAYSLSISRFVDRDMLMRYHWGCAIGHLYTHDPTTVSALEHSPDFEVTECAATECPLQVVNDARQDTNQILDGRTSAVDQTELDLRNHDDDEWEDAGTDDDESGEESEDDVFAAMNEMHGS